MVCEFCNWNLAHTHGVFNKEKLEYIYFAGGEGITTQNFGATFRGRGRYNHTEFWGNPTKR